MASTDIDPREGLGRHQQVPHRRTTRARDASYEDNLFLDSDSQIFEDNDQGLIDNPLRHLDSDDIKRKAEHFVEDHGLSKHKDIFIKAGQILRDPEAWAIVPGLTEEEKECLEHETSNGFWAQPKGLKVTIITLCVAAVVQGWNQTAANGANLQWPEQLGLHLTGCDPVGRDAWIFAIVNAVPYFSAALCGAWIADPLNEYFLGRRPAICISGILILASMIGSACSQTWRQLLACRVLLGIGMGTKASTVPIFAAEVAPAHIRGSLVMNWQLFDALGIFLGFTANLIVSGVGETAWRWQTASSVLPTIVLLTLIFVSSDSPRFLMKRGTSTKYKDAYSTLLSLRGHPILAAKELLYTHYQMEVEKRFISGKVTETDINHEESEIEESKGTTTSRTLSKARMRQVRSINYWQKLSQLFTNKRIRRAMVAAVVVMVSQQLCGVNVLAIYSSTLFCNSGDTDEGKVTDTHFLEPLFLSWGIGLTNFLFAFPAYFLIDKRGRRWLLLIALPFMALSMLAASLSYQIPSNSGAHSPIIGLFTYIFMVFYSPSMGPVPFTMSAEVFPLENRVVGMSFAVFANMLGLGCLVLFVPIITGKSVCPSSPKVRLLTLTSSCK